VLHRSGRNGRIMGKGRQGPDHPMLPDMPETSYLHCTVFEIA
jgi:23S rRNA G2069 N7-methylase RlmK/C1962 C5-methylase RlmI